MWPLTVHHGSSQSATRSSQSAPIAERQRNHLYYAALRADGRIVLKACLNGSNSSLGSSINTGITTNAWYSVKVIATGTHLSLYVDGALVQSVSGVLITKGAIALGTNNVTAEFDDVQVTAP